MFHLCHLVLNDMKNWFLKFSHPLHQYLLVILCLNLPYDLLSATLQLFPYLPLHDPLTTTHYLLIFLEFYFFFLMGFHLAIVLALDNLYPFLIVLDLSFESVDDVIVGHSGVQKGLNFSVFLFLELLAWSNFLMKELYLCFETMNYSIFLLV